MHYIIFGKYHRQNKPLDSNIKLFLWDKDALVRMFAQKFLNHKTKSNLHNKDVFFLEKATVYKLDQNLFEENGDIIMIDTSTIQNIKYPVIEIHNTDLNTFCKKLNDSNISIQLINL